MAYWSIRAGENDEARDVCLISGVIAMDWEPPDLAELPNDGEAFKEAYRKARPPKDAEMANPQKYKKKVEQNAGTMRRFVYDMKVGDYVVYPSDHPTPKNGWIYLGRLIGHYQHDPQQPLKFCHQREVSWLVAYPRAAFSEDFLSSIGSSRTLISMDAHAQEIQAKLAQAVAVESRN